MLGRKKKRRQQRAEERPPVLDEEAVKQLEQSRFDADLQTLQDASSADAAQAKTAKALGERGDARAVPALIEVLRLNHREPGVEGTVKGSPHSLRVKTAAATALAQIGDKRAVPALKAVLEVEGYVEYGGNPDPDKRYEFQLLADAARSALSAIGDRGKQAVVDVAGRREGASAIKELADLAQRGESLPEEGRDALAHAAARGLTESTGIVISDTAPETRAAIAALMKLGDPRLVDVLEDAHPPGQLPQDDFIRATIRDLLAQQPPGGAFRRFIDDHTWAVWLVVAEDWKSLVEVGEPAVSVLGAYLHGPGNLCQHPMMAIEALARVGGEKAIATLVSAVEGNTNAPIADSAKQLARVVDAARAHDIAADLRESASGLRAKPRPPSSDELMGEYESWEEVSEEVEDRTKERERHMSRSDALDKAADILDRT